MGGGNGARQTGLFNTLLYILFSQGGRGGPEGDTLLILWPNPPSRSTPLNFLIPFFISMGIMEEIVSGVISSSKEEEYRRMGPCGKLFCSHKTCPEALCDIVFDRLCGTMCDALCGALCGALCCCLCGTTNSKPVLSTVPPTAEGAAGAAVVAAAASTGDAK